MAYDPDYHLSVQWNYKAIFAVELHMQRLIPSARRAANLELLEIAIKSIDAGILLISKHRVPFYRFSFDTYPVPNSGK